MPIDPSIPLRAFGGGGGSLSNPMGMMQDFVQLQRQQEELRAEQDARRRQQEIQRIMQTSGDDWDSAIDQIGRIDLGIASKLRTEVEQGRKAAADTLDQQFKTDLAKFDLALKAFDGIEDMEESQREITYQLARGFALQLAEGIPGVADLFPDNYDQGAVDRLRQIGSKGNEYYTARLAALKAMGSGDLHTSLALGLSGSESPETWAETIQGFRQLAGSKLADPVIAQFGAEFSPESLTRAREWLLTPRTHAQAMDEQRVAETGRHNLATEAQTVVRDTQAHQDRLRGQNMTDARQRAQAGGGAGPSAMPSEWQTALSRTLLAVPAVRRPMIIQTAERLWKEGKQDELKELIVQSAVEGEPVATRSLVQGRRGLVASMSDAASMLAEMEREGVPTDLLRGTAEDVARRLGTSTNPRYAEFGARMRAALQNYRRAISGAQFSVQESAEYESLFPNYRQTFPVNQAVLRGLLREMGTQDKAYWEGKLGKAGAELVGALPSSRGNARAYTGEVRQMPDGRMIGLVDGKPVEVVKSGNGYVVK